MLKALGFVAYKSGQGFKKNIAKADVFNAYGVVGQKVYESWKKSSRHAFGDFRVERVISHGEIAGSRERRRTAEPDTVDQFADLLVKNYGDEALLKASQEFRQLRAMAGTTPKRMRKTPSPHPKGGEKDGSRTS
jgi:hypothetical protein